MSLLQGPHRALTSRGFGLVGVSLLIGWVAILTTWQAVLAADESGWLSASDLKKTSVCLTINGFIFGSGLVPNAEGNPDGNGVELVPCERDSAWTGSGFIVGRKGTVATNFHVAKRALGGFAKFADGRTYAIFEIEAADPANDIALLRLKASETLDVVGIGDSDEIEEMENVLAVGCPLDGGLSFTKGMVNKVERDSTGDMVAIVHDAVIAPGSSGGPLYKGQSVIGINTGTIPPWGINCAIPINKLKALMAASEGTEPIPLEEAFPPDPNRIIERAQQFHAVTNQVPPQAEGEPGIWGVQTVIVPLQDLFLRVVAEDGNDLSLVVMDLQTQSMVGFGDARGGEIEPLFLASSTPMVVGVAVLNYSDDPVNFALEFYAITW